MSRGQSMDSAQTYSGMKIIYV